VDGHVTKVYGPYGTKYAANYAGLLSNLAAGNHTYAISVTDASGAARTNQYTGTFTMAGPAGNGTVATSQATAAVFAQNSSVAADWVVNLDGLTTTSPPKKGNLASAVDAVLAGY
jgi:hypothetical protein